jgi:aminomethyltransferase
MASDTEQTLSTPLLANHEQLGAKLVPFAGWRMPLDYGSILGESRAVRTTAGIFDVSHMARFLFRGSDVAEQLDRALGGAIIDQPVGKARYTMILQEDGGIMDDLITYRTAEDEIFMVVNASNRERDWDILMERLPELECSDLTEDGGGILAIQGPESKRMLAELSGSNDFCPEFLDLGQLDSPFGELFIARTGYTGEHGYEIFVTAEQIVPVWEKLIELGAAPVGLGSRDVLRLEAALALYGHEIHEGVTPFDAGLRFAVKGWKTRDFIGGDALRAIETVERELIGFTAEKRVPREGYKVFCDGEEVGVICSGVFSATLEKPIATAMVKKGCDGAFSVDFRGKQLPVERAATPFVAHRSRA